MNQTNSFQTMVASSVSCICSFIFLVMFISFITVTDSQFNIILNPLVGIELAVLAVFFQCALRGIVLSTIFPANFSLLQNKNLKHQFFNIFICLSLLGFSSVVFYAIAVCFGAPLLSKTSETFHFGCLLTGLVVLPSFLVIGANVDSLTRVFFENNPDLGLECVVTFTSVCSLLGAWLGAVPIPLDWDRPWQEWPVSCSLGGLGGYTVGLMLAALYLPMRYRAVLKSKDT